MLLTHGVSHGKYYKLIVANKGIGFPNDQAVKIFDPFTGFMAKTNMMVQV